MSVREHWINVRVNPEELARIREKQKELGIRNTGAYMRKMAMDGYCVNLDLSDVAQVSTLLRRCSTSFNKKHTIFMDFTPSFFFSSSFYRTRLSNTTMSTGRPAKNM